MAVYYAMVQSGGLCGGDSSAMLEVYSVVRSGAVVVGSFAILKVVFNRHKIGSLYHQQYHLLCYKF